MFAQNARERYSVLQCVSVCCRECMSVCAKVHVRGTQYGLTCFERDCNTLQHTATHCSTLQHIATHTIFHRGTQCGLTCFERDCKTLQHTATHTMLNRGTHCGLRCFEQEILLFDLIA